mmetsp:Transcript_45407/g.84329  ORF Transcript_45407/g.84329 Transcript_45407/m.84329 type:complete len:114 (-) Transcript_45407:1041-1382(-)
MVEIISSSSSSSSLPSSSWRYEAEDLSRDHNAREAQEQSRIFAQHPDESQQELVQCMRQKICYVKGRLQPTRAFGDLYLKRAEFNGPPHAKRHGLGQRTPLRRQRQRRRQRVK